MRGDRNQNHYTNYDHDGFMEFNQHREKQDSRHDSVMISGLGTHEGSSNNAAICSSLDQTSSSSLGLNLQPQGCSPIGLSLRKSNSLINLVEMTLSQEKERKNTSQRTPEKLKASNFAALILQIGSWKRISRNEGDLIAKLYYAKKKLVWEFLDGPLKNKIEIQWSDISAITASMDEGQLGHLQIELNQPPQFGRETNPQPRKHTQWKQTTDFTGGQTSICRRHSIIFPPGVLDKHYEKLLQCDNRLFNLSQQPFPVNNYPYFFHDPNNSYMNVTHRLPNHFLGDFDSSSTISALAFPYSGEGVTRHANERWNQFDIHIVQDHFLPYYGRDSVIPVQESQTETIFEEPEYVNDAIPWSQASSGIGFQEHSSWIGVPNVYGVSWETGVEEVGCLNVNQHYYPNWT